MTLGRHHESSQTDKINGNKETSKWRKPSDVKGSVEILINFYELKIEI